MNTSIALATLMEFAGNMAHVIERAGGSVAHADFATLCTLLGIEPSDAWLAVVEATLPSDLVDRLHASLGDEVRFNGESPEAAIALVLAARTQARATKDWAASDRLRDALLACGIAIKDGKEGTTWTVNT
jgi:cysteinyl-tRNA synthetase